MIPRKLSRLEAPARFRLVSAATLAAFIALLLLSGCDGTGALFGVGSGGSYSTFQMESLEEINFLRTDPAGYAELRLADDYGAGTDNGAYTDLRSRPAVSALALDAQLCTAATDYAEYMATHNVFGHYERLTPAERCAEAGYEFYSGENLSAGSFPAYHAEADPETAAIAFVEMLVIDEGVVGVGHRENLLSDVHGVVGVGYHRDTESTYHNYYVQDFGRQ